MGAPKLQKLEKSIDHEKVFLAHYQWLLKWARQLTQGSTSEAEDLVQDLYVRFVQASAGPKIGDDDQLRGYLYKTLKNLFISGRLRHGRDALSSLLIVDFDSLEFALSAVDRSRLLLVRSDLSSICEYACIRRASHRAASALILRFFLGYFPTEIMGLLQSSRAAIDKLTQTARLEARAYLTKPGSLHFMGQDRTRPKVFPLHLPDNPEALYAELRRRIFLETEGPCLPPSKMAERYAEVSDTRLTTLEIAHLVSCKSCLDEANQILGFPTLSQRFSSDGGEPGDGDPPSAATGEDKTPKLRRKLRETYEHRPVKLQIAINGEVRAVQLITSSHSTFQIKLEPLAHLEFVEVLSEQGVRLLYHYLETADVGDPTEQQAEVELSDHRRLAVAINWDSGVPVVEVSYFDPLVEGDPASVALQLPAPAVRHSDQLTEPEGTPSLCKRLFARQAKLGLHWPRSVGMATVVAAALIVTCLVSFNARREKTNVQETAASLIARSRQNRDASIPSHGAIHRTFAFEVRSDGGDIIETGKIDSLRSSEPSRRVVRLFGPDGKLLAGRSVDGAGKTSNYSCGFGSRRPTSDPDRQRFNDTWAQIPDADEFDRLTGDPAALKVRRDTDGYELTYTRSRPSDDAGLVQARLVLKDGSLRPVAETLHVRDQERTREYRFTELSYEVLPPSRVQDNDFALGPSLVDMRSRQLGVHADPAGSAHLILQAFQLLNNLGPDVEDMVDLDRLPDGSVQISGVLPTQQQKAAVVSVFSSLTPHRQLKLELHSRDEPSPPISERTIPTIESLPTVAAQGGRIPLDAELREGLLGQGAASESLDGRIREIASDALSRGARMHREAWTVRQIAVRDLSIDDLRSMPPDDRMLWLTLLDKHTRSFDEQLTLLDTDLGPLLQNRTAKSSAHVAGEIPLPNNFKELGTIADVLNHDSERLDRLLTAGLALFPSDIPPNPNVAEIAELLADLRIQEGVLHETVKRLQAGSY